MTLAAAMPPAHVASLINALTLVVAGVWAYLASNNPSVTALIPVAAGVALLALNRGVKTQNKVVAHIAVLITAVMLVALFMPLKGAIGRGSIMAVVRVLAMLGTTALAMAAFIKSFRDARRARD